MLAVRDTRVKVGFSAPEGFSLMRGRNGRWGVECNVLRVTLRYVVGKWNVQPFGR